MKRTLITSLLASALLFGGGCSDDFDDSALWKGVDEIYNQLTELEKQADQLNDQIRLLSSIVNGGAITSITQDAEGNDVIRFKGADNIEHSVTVATKDDVSSAPILGTKEENGVLYWTTTVDGNTDFLKDTDGSKIPVAGRTPEMAVDKEGYWTLNGRRLTDASGNPVKAEGKQTSLITGISRDDNGNAIFTLGDGSTVSAPIFDAFNIVFKIGDTAFDDEYTVEDVSQPLTIGYEITGEKADEAILKIVRCEQLAAVVDTSAETVVVTFEAPFEEGCFALMLCDLQENVLIRMVRLASASAKPEYYGIKTADDLREFARAVNTGRNYDRYRDETGDVVLLDDVDMNGITEWTAIGTTEHPFSGKFNGKGHTIRNIAWTADAAKSTAHGLFGVLNQASVRNLTVGGSGDRIIVRGTAAAGTAIAGVAAFATESVIENVANNVSISFEGEDPADTPVMLAGIVGQMSGTTLGGQSAEAGCTNNGDITSGAIANTGNGGTAGSRHLCVHQKYRRQLHGSLHQQRTRERTLRTRRRAGRNLREGNHRQLDERRTRRRRRSRTVRRTEGQIRHQTHGRSGRRFDLGGVHHRELYQFRKRHLAPRLPYGRIRGAQCRHDPHLQEHRRHHRQRDRRRFGLSRSRMGLRL